MLLNVMNSPLQGVSNQKERISPSIITIDCFANQPSNLSTSSSIIGNLKSMFNWPHQFFEVDAFEIGLDDQRLNTGTYFNGTISSLTSLDSSVQYSGISIDQPELSNSFKFYNRHMLDLASSIQKLSTRST